MLGMSNKDLKVNKSSEILSNIRNKINKLKISDIHLDSGTLVYMIHVSNFYSVLH